ncbi:MAG: tetratricopeptide repeat protein [Candidatus Scalinduaceae bacterium]
MRNKSIIMGVISLAFLGGLGYLCYVIYQNAQTKYLREAIAYEGVSRYEEAVKSYEQYLSNYPKDIFTRLRYAMTWHKLNEEDKYIKLLHKIAHEISELKPEERDILRSNENWHTLLGELVETATNRTLNSSEAASYTGYIKSILAKEHSDIYDNFVSGKYNNESKAIEALLELANTQGKYAFMLWFDENKEGVLVAMRTYEDFFTRFFEKESKSWATPYSISKWKEAKARNLASLLLRAGKDRFDKKEYHEARKTFADGVKYSTHSGLKKDNPLVSELMYNMAMTYWYEGAFFSAETTLLALQKKSPEYEKDKVTKQIIHAKEKVANNRFNKRRYKEAREAYEDAIAYCISAGYKVNSPLVAEFIYKIAKTYGMEGDYSSEKSTLLYLRNLSPEYRSKFILVRPVIR